MDSLFGGEVPAAAKFVIAFVVVLLLIALLAWLVRRLGSGALSGAARGRQPRLAVVDAATVDARRRLILVRRDNVEHLLMIGGPTDLVVEPNILRGAAAPREAPAAAAVPPLPAATSPILPEPPAPAPSATAESEPQLPDMAQQLEAALRREPRLDVPAETQPVGGVPEVEPPSLMPPPAADAAVPAVHPEPPLAPRPGHDKSFYEDLEREMASLLNRPTGKP